MVRRNSLKLSKNRAFLVFKDGTVYEGVGIGAKGVSVGEMCFNTSMTGYQEIITDPSYSEQIINFTFVHVGNVGANEQDCESAHKDGKIYAKGIVLRNLPTFASNYRSETDFNDWLIENSVTGICGVDTRAIAKKTKKDPQNAAICYFENIETQSDFERKVGEVMNILESSKDMSGLELAKDSSTAEEYAFGSQRQGSLKDSNDSDLSVVVLDYGVKQNILKCLKGKGFNIIVLPADSSFEDVMRHCPSGVCLSNGPGDPSATFEYAGDTIKKLLNANVPILAICLGHQMLSIALGGKTEKMAQGHRGANHPILNLQTGRVEITSQNHGFATSETKNIASYVSHKSLFDGTIAGLHSKEKGFISVQYHPESSPGPHDSRYLFEDFYNIVVSKNKIKNDGESCE